MSWEIVTLFLIAVFVIVMIAMRKNPYVKKYWKYSLILIPAVVVIILSIINKRKSISTSGENDLANAIGKLKDDLQETNLEAAVEVSAAKAKSTEKLKELVDIKKEPDQKERIKRLAGMIG